MRRRAHAHAHAHTHAHAHAHAHALKARTHGCRYINTVGRIEPSYVIQKFLDAQRIHNLTSYLGALHEKGIAKADHTTLLLNCYTKVRTVFAVPSVGAEAY